MKEPRKSTGRPCSICSHTAVDEINGLIRQRVGFRNISQVHGMDIASVSRHTANHLRIDLQAVQIEKRIQGAVNVEKENIEQLNAAKEVRDQAREYAATMPEGEVIPAFKAVMDGVKTVNVTLDTQSKLKGLYQQDRVNEQDATKAIQLELDKFVKYCESKPELSPRQILAELRENTPMNPVYAMLLSAQVEVMELGEQG